MQFMKAIIMEPITFISLIKRFELHEEDCNQEVVDTHIEDISRSCSCQWKNLPSYLGMRDNVPEDIEHEQKSEVEKRLTFFKQWKQMRGSEATYKCLITALLNIDRTKDAEHVCQLIKECIGTSLHSKGLSNTTSGK